MTALAEPEHNVEQHRPAQAAPSGSAMIVFEDVRKVYEPNVVALDGVSFVIDKGEFVFVVGASGSGKSTRHPPPAQGARADRRPDHRRRPRPRAPQALEGAAAAPQPRLRLPGLQAPPEPHRRREHRLRAHASRASRTRRSARRCPRSWTSSGSRTRWARAPRSSPAASSSASRSRARSSTTRRCSSATSRPGTSTPTRPSGSCSSSTASTAPARRSSWSPTTARWSTRCASASSRSRRQARARRAARRVLRGMTRIRMLFAEALRSIGATSRRRSRRRCRCSSGCSSSASSSASAPGSSRGRTTRSESSPCTALHRRRGDDEADQRACASSSSRTTASSRAASLHLQGEGARDHAQAQPRAHREPRPNPLPASFDVVPKRGRTPRRSRSRSRARSSPGVDAVRYGKEVSERILQIAARSSRLPHRRLRAPRGLDDPHREHDPAVDVLPSPRDRGDEARRRVELVRARPVHARGLLTGLAGSVAAVVLLFLAARSRFRRSSATSGTTPTSRRSRSDGRR